MKMNYLNDSDHDDIRRYSSIDQYVNFLAALKGGKELPIRFDNLDWINCDGVKTHPIIVSFGDDIGYNFPIGHYTYFTDTYVIMDRKGTEVRKLPHWFGEGWYEKAINDKVFTNFDGSSLGERNVHYRRIGLDYILTDKVLEDSDEE